ncbi:MAG TPA: EF-hand domain-containing protein, partial [Gemmataceae bacterium]|nr:EF-hand domain-containing protein [Gemmataceae bacterium]
MKIRFACLALLVLFISWSMQAAGQPAKQTQPGVKADPRDLVFLGGSRPLLIRLDIRMHGKPLQAAWDEFIDYLFKYADLDGDGVLSKEEAEAAPQPSMLLNNFGFVGFGPRGAGGGKMDANGDGKVTRAEFADYYRQSGLPPFNVQLESSKNNRRNGFMPFMKKTPPTSQLNAALLKLLDTNNDGKLSREELKAAEAILLKLDSDEDEIVTPQELLPDFSPLSLGLEERAYFAGPERQPAPANDPLFLASTEQPREIARRLLTRYGLDKTKKVLTREQLNLDAATFAALDRDGNGELDAEELARFAARPPDLEFVVRVGDRNAREAAVEMLTRKGGSVSVKARMAG